MIIGDGHIIGPLMARRGADTVGVRQNVYAADVQPLKPLERKGMETVQCDLLDRKAADQPPHAEVLCIWQGGNSVQAGANGSPERPMQWFLTM